MPSRGQVARPRRPTLRDVAARAGVSISTASLVFSGRGPVAPPTAERVRSAAADLGYAGPDPLASSLRHGRTGTVAVVIEGRLSDAFADPFALRLIDGLAQSLDVIPAAMLLIPRPEGRPERLLEQLAVAPCDAVVFALCGPKDEPAVDLLCSRGIPMVGTGAPEDKRVPQLRIDERGASAGAARLLRKLGHRRVAHLTMPLSPAAHTVELTAAPAAMAQAVYPDARERLRGFLDVFPRGRVVQSARADVAEGEAAARLLLGAPVERRPTALVAQSDLLAAGAWRAALALGLSVPGDLSIVGFDGVPLPWLDAQLTTIDQDGVGKGRALGSMVAAVLQGRQVRSRTFPVQLREADTTAPPRSA